MRLMDELVGAYLDNFLEHHYYLDLLTGQVILELDDSIDEDFAINWDDEGNINRYICIPQIDSNEAYHVRIQFAKRTESDPDMKLFDALEGQRPFRRFKIYFMN